MTGWRAYEIIDNAKSSQTELDEAIRYLDILVDSNAYWLELAADEKRTPLLRRMAVKHVFDRYVAGGITLEHLCKTLQVPANWISFDQIHKIRGEWTGRRPNAIASGGFVIPVLSEQDGQYRLVLLIRFDPKENLDKEQLVAALKGKLGQADRSVLIADCRAFDTVDNERLGTVWIWESLEANTSWEALQGNKKKSRTNLPSPR